MGGKFKFQVQDSDLEYFFGDLTNWKEATFTKTTGMESAQSCLCDSPISYYEMILISQEWERQ